MADILTTVSSAITLAARLREIGKSIEDAGFENLLADLSLVLADAKLKISDLVLENVSLKEKLDEVTSATGERFQVAITGPSKFLPHVPIPLSVD